MEQEATATTTYWWCHMCTRNVDPLMEAEIKCPFCASGFVEEMAEEEEEEQQHSPNTFLLAENESVDSQLQEILRRRRRGTSSVSVMHLRAGSTPTLEPDESNGDGGGGGVIMVSAGSLSDYFIGPAFEVLLQRLAEDDPNRYGTPPARKEVVEALATVKIQEANLQCSVCLDDFEIGMEAKEMPCNHRFHGDCLLPWLELHSSCPVCRYLLPSDETKTDSATTEQYGNYGGSESSSSSSSEEEEESDDGDGIEFSIRLFSSLFSSSQGSISPSTDTN